MKRSEKSKEEVILENKDQKLETIPVNQDESPTSEPESEGGGILDWLIDNNPLYLLSVIFMFGGLLLVSKASYQVPGQVGPDATLATVVAFFGVQNVYEIIMVGMAIYLIANRVNARHGKILLALELLFLADLTYYQVRIASMSASSQEAFKSWAISGGYLVLAAAKLIAVTTYLRLQIPPHWLFYPLAAFATIYFGPQYLYYAVDGVGTAGSFKVLASQGVKSVSNFSGVSDLYFIWLVAALIQIPVIIRGWKQKAVPDSIPNELVGDESPLYYVLFLFPFLIVPIQTIANVYPDAIAANAALNNPAFIIPYLVLGLFFVDAFCSKQIDETIGRNQYHFWGLMAVMVLALVAGGTLKFYPDLQFTVWDANKSLIIAAHLIVGIGRGNAMSLGFIGVVVVYHLIGFMKSIAQNVYDQTKDLSLVQWASMLMGASFVFLGLGFWVSVRGAKSRRAKRPE